MKRTKNDGDVLTIDDVYYVRATSALADDRTRVLKYGSTFGVFNRYGDIESIRPLPFGLFHAEARHLSKLVLHIDHRQPLLLASSVREDYGSLNVDLTNSDALDASGNRKLGGTVHIYRNIVFGQDCCVQSFRLLTYSSEGMELPVSFYFDADFVDIFEARGSTRKASGVILPAQADASEVTLAYRGLDRVERRTRLQFSDQPITLTSHESHFLLSLRPAEERYLALTVRFEREPVDGVKLSSALPQRFSPWKSIPPQLHSARIQVSNVHFEAWLSRSESDLVMLTAGNPEKDYPYAGIPWFSTVFGRDGIITALECLWIAPQIGRGVLQYLSETQAQTEDPANDAEPGKIVHETRAGEMASLREVPFGKYYGSADATPLFLILAHAYFERTNDLSFIRSIWPNILAALQWMDRWGDVDGDGFVEYGRKSENGLVQQGWKDSQDSVFHADGHLAKGPIALCEIQGYVYRALKDVARLSRCFDQQQQASELDRRAELLKQRFDEEFWHDELGTYAIALDGAKRPCRVRSSNAGQTLFTGIAPPERAREIARTLLDEASFSGWGIRTIASGESRYNPMSYHNGSVWPHDNALIALGFSRYGMTAETVKVCTAIYEASSHFNSYRVPELFCGFHKRPGMAGPTLYPVACSPQAWAAGSVYLLLASLLGIHIDAPRLSVTLLNPQLPAFLPELSIRGLEVAGATVDLLFRRMEKGVDIRIENNTGIEVHLPQ